VNSQPSAASPDSSNVARGSGRDTSSDAARHPSSALAPVEEVIEAIRRGEMVVLVDGPDWASEGDVVMAGERVDARAINFMATHARGLVRMPMEQERLAELAIPPMARRNSEGENVALHMGVDAREGTTTGISADDRARTARALANPGATPAAFTMPGHLFPLAAHADGLRGRCGHTEAAVELARMADFAPAAVMCEIADADGRMARLPRLVDFAAEHGLLIGSVEDVAQIAGGRSRIERVVSTALPVDGTTFAAVGYRDHRDGREHMALVLGDVDDTDPLVRVHAACVPGDVFASRRCACHRHLSTAIDALRQEGTGVIVYLREHGGMGVDIAGHADDERDDDEAAAAILRDLGVRSIRLMSASPERSRAMERHGIQVTGCTPLHGARAPDERRPATVHHAGGRHVVRDAAGTG
jgi:3,4-dihydroxy 2-butanone 4-phosphate synthase/GTP cyclohydrolase II